jgi:hypothetical protein
MKKRKFGLSFINFFFKVHFGFFPEKTEVFPAQSRACPYLKQPEGIAVI